MSFSKVELLGLTRSEGKHDDRVDEGNEGCLCSREAELGARKRARIGALQGSRCEKFGDCESK